MIFWLKSSTAQIATVSGFLTTSEQSIPKSFPSFTHCKPCDIHVSDPLRIQLMDSHGNISTMSRFPNPMMTGLSHPRAHCLTVFKASITTSIFLAVNILITRLPSRRYLPVPDLPGKLHTCIKTVAQPKSIMIQLHGLFSSHEIR